jgi:hypothetical protein
MLTAKSLGVFSLTLAVAGAAANTDPVFATDVGRYDTRGSALSRHCAGVVRYGSL